MRASVHVQAVTIGVIGAALLLFTLTACEEAITPLPTDEPTEERRVVTVLSRSRNEHC